MKQLIGFIKSHRKVLQILFQLLILVLTFIVVYEELRQIKGSELRELANDLSPTHALFLGLAGTAAFSVNMVYDWLFARYLRLRIPLARILEVGFISQAFNGFVGLGGATGATLRTRLYGEEQVMTKDAVKMSFGISWMSLIGLFVIGFASVVGVVFRDPILFRLMTVILILALLLYFFGEKWPIPPLRSEFSPLVYLSHRDRFQILAASTIEWLCGGLFFTYAIRIYQGDVGWLLGLLVFSIGTVIGFLSFIPGGLGTFEGACFIIFHRLGYSAPHLALSLLTARLAYTILPWILALLLLSGDWLWHRRFLRSGDRK